MPELLRDRFALAYKHNRIMFFHAPCGSGKTAMVLELLKLHKICYISAKDSDFSEATIRADCKALVVDDLHCLNNRAHIESLCEIIRTRKSRRIVLLSRGGIPGWLMPFQFSGILEDFDADDLLLDKSSIQKLSKAYALSLTAPELGAIEKDSKGYCVMLAILMRLLSEHRSYDHAVLSEGKQQLFLYFDELVYQRLELPLRQLLIQVASFETWDTELAMLLSGESHVGELIAQLQQDSSMLLPGDPDQISLRPIFRAFLLWKLPRELDDAEQKNIFSRAGLYYELKEKMKSALDCYSKVGDQRKISELLVKNAHLHVGIGQYVEMERYYFAMPETEIRRSPTLMAGMSMLCSLSLDFERSEYWYDALQEYASGLKKSDAEYRDAQGRLAYLDIALPQRGSKGLIDIITNVFKVMKNKELSLPTFSVTSTLPSVLNGGKDFSEWTKQDTLLYATLRKPLESVLGRDGVALADCSICESFFEKDEEYQPRLLTLLSRLSEIQRHGSPDIEFAAIGLLARTQLAEGQAQTALETVTQLRARFTEIGETRFLPTMNALLCRIYMQQGNLVELDRWMKDKAPQDSFRIWALHRYLHLTRAMGLIATGEENLALTISARLLPYFEKCSRTIDQITVHILCAICYFRKSNKHWQEEITLALDLSHTYRYIRPISEYGVAVLPLLTACGWKTDRAYLDRLIAVTRVQAVNYPLFLQQEVKLTEPLTAAEQQVLRLVCHNRSNQEIADTLGIQLTTTKTHVSRILKKLNVNSRSQAKEAAEHLELL